jgi:hypothetical protein
VIVEGFHVSTTGFGLAVVHAGAGTNGSPHAIIVAAATAAIRNIGFLDMVASSKIRPDPNTLIFVVDAADAYKKIRYSSERSGVVPVTGVDARARPGTGSPTGPSPRSVEREVQFEDADPASRLAPGRSAKVRIILPSESCGNRRGDRVASPSAMALRAPSGMSARPRSSGQLTLMSD